MSDSCDKPAADRGELPQAQRRELIRRGHELRARTAVGRRGLTDAFVDQLRQAMQKMDLIKVRIEAESGEEATALSRELAGRIGARVVQRVGRVALLFRPLSGGSDDE